MYYIHKEHTEREREREREMHILFIHYDFNCLFSTFRSPTSSTKGLHVYNMYNVAYYNFPKMFGILKYHDQLTYNISNRQ